MGAFGLQPNGMIRLSDGTLWNPHDALPPDPVGFNGTPMGNPLQPQTLPRMAAPPSGPTSPLSAGMAPMQPPAPTPAQAPRGMFGASPQMPVSQVNVPDPNIPSSFFGSGGTGTYAGKAGTGTRILDGLSAFANTALAAQGNPAGLQWMQQQGLQKQVAKQQQIDAYRQSLEFQRQLALQQSKPQEPGSFEKNYGYLKSLDPKLADQYAQQFSAGPPIVGTVNGVTGLISRQSFGGASPSSAKPSVDWSGAVAYLRSNPGTAAQFDEQFGQGAAKAVLGQ